ncbi:MAG: HIT domain-containing protein [Candidatus Absconditabacterales bacterium]
MDCIFCKIVAGEIPSVKIREDDNFIALLDAFPACKGQVLVLPKKHYDSDIFLMDNDFYTLLLLAAKDVVALMKKGLGVDKIGMVVEGLQVPHAHIKLYPFRGGKSFEGGLTGHTLADINELKNIANQIKTV